MKKERVKQVQQVLVQCEMAGHVFVPMEWNEFNSDPIERGGRDPKRSDTSKWNSGMK